MTDHDGYRSEHALPLDPALDWLDAQGTALARPVSAELIAGGRSNLTYRLNANDGTTVVLRRPPSGNVLATAHDMGREWRFISALWPTAVPVARPLAWCHDLEVVGAPFYVMGYVEGTVLDAGSDLSAFPLDARRRAGLNMVDVLATLHGLDVDAIGLGDIARRENYADRQLRRWKRQWDQTKLGDVAVMEEVQRALERAVPPQTRTGVVHGDFRLGNLLCSLTGEVRAVLDWELATLGDPLADLGWILAYWPFAPDMADPSVAPVDGFPGRHEVIERYQRRSGNDTTALEFYEAFSYWRSACIAAGVAARYRAGVMGELDGVDMAALDSAVTRKAEIALEVLNGRKR